MGKLLQILSGYSNLLFENKEIEKMAEERAKICDGCDEAIYAIGALYLHCGHCKCFLPAMHRSKDKHCYKGLF